MVWNETGLLRRDPRAHWPLHLPVLGLRPWDLPEGCLQAWMRATRATVLLHRHQAQFRAKAPNRSRVARFWQVYSMWFSSLGLCGNGSNFGRKLGDPNFYINHFGLLEHVVTSIHAQNSRVVQFEFQLQASTCSPSWSFAATNCPSRNCGCCSLRTAAATTPRAEPWAMSWQPSWSCWRAKQCWNWMQAEKQLGESCDALIF